MLSQPHNRKDSTSVVWFTGSVPLCPSVAAIGLQMNTCQLCTPPITSLSAEDFNSKLNGINLYKKNHYSCFKVGRIVLQMIGTLLKAKLRTCVTEHSAAFVCFTIYCYRRPSCHLGGKLFVSEPFAGVPGCQRGS